MTMTSTTTMTMTMTSTTGSYRARYFKPSEFACKCGRPDCDAPPPADELLRVLDVMRDAYGRPIVINSGSRCRAHNAAQPGSAADSAHLFGLAADLAIRGGYQRYRMLRAAITCGVHRIGIGRSFVHVDVDDSKPASVAWLY